MLAFAVGVFSYERVNTNSKKNNRKEEKGQVITSRTRAERSRYGVGFLIHTNVHPHVIWGRLGATALT